MMRRNSIFASTLCAAALSVASATAIAADSGPGYVETVLASDGIATTPNNNVALGNTWGLAASPGGPWWVTDNNTAKTTLVGAGGATLTSFNTPHNPSGIVFNGTGDFVLTNPGTGAKGTALFIYSTESGEIGGWNPTATPPPTDYAKAYFKPGAVYKGLAIYSDPIRGARLYATEFAHNTVDVFDADFKPLWLPCNFADPGVPEGFAPFGIQTIGKRIYVTYAKQDATHEDDVPGPGLGYVSAYDADGCRIMSLKQGTFLDAPWGIALAPADFGNFGGKLLIGNFGSGRIHAFDPQTGDWVGELSWGNHEPIQIDGLWAIAFGNGGSAGPVDSLYFAAGPNQERDGLFGVINAAPGGAH